VLPSILAEELGAVPVERRSLVAFMDPAFAVSYLQQTTMPPDPSPAAAPNNVLEP